MIILNLTDFFTYKFNIDFLPPLAKINILAIFELVKPRSAMRSAVEFQNVPHKAR